MGEYSEEVSADAVTKNSSWQSIVNYIVHNDAVPVMGFIIGGMVARLYLIEEPHTISMMDIIETPFELLTKTQLLTLSEALNDGTIFNAQENESFIINMLEALVAPIVNTQIFDISCAVLGGAIIPLYIAFGLEGAIVSTILGLAFNWQMGSVDNLIIDSFQYLQDHYVISTAVTVVGGVVGYYDSWNDGYKLSLIDDILLAVILMDPMPITELLGWVYNGENHMVYAIIASISSLTVSTTIGMVFEWTYEKIGEFVSDNWFVSGDIVQNNEVDMFAFD